MKFIIFEVNLLVCERVKYTAMINSLFYRNHEMIPRSLRSFWQWGLPRSLHKVIVFDKNVFLSNRNLTKFSFFRKFVLYDGFEEMSDQSWSRRLNLAFWIGFKAGLRVIILGLESGKSFEGVSLTTVILAPGACRRGALSSSLCVRNACVCSLCFSVFVCVSLCFLSSGRLDFVRRRGTSATWPLLAPGSSRRRPT